MKSLRMSLFLYTIPILWYCVYKIKDVPLQSEKRLYAQG